MTASWPRPTIGPDTQPFWDYAAAHELRVQRCGECGHLRWPAGPVCPRCWSSEAEWERMSGRGFVQSWVVYRRQYQEAFPVPYAVALVELEEGPRMEATLLEVDVDQVEWRMPVAVSWQERGGLTLPCFAPAEVRTSASEGGSSRVREGR